MRDWGIRVAYEAGSLLSFVLSYWTMCRYFLTLIRVPLADTQLLHSSRTPPVPRILLLVSPQRVILARLIRIPVISIDRRLGPLAIIDDLIQQYLSLNAVGLEAVAGTELWRGWVLEVFG